MNIKNIKRKILFLENYLSTDEEKKVQKKKKRKIRKKGKIFFLVYIHISLKLTDVSVVLGCLRREHKKNFLQGKKNRFFRIEEGKRR